MKLEVAIANIGLEDQVYREVGTASNEPVLLDLGYTHRVAGTGGN
ncbi:MAG: hypothetical protein V7709_02520 [Halioglobus sp.]